MILHVIQSIRLQFLRKNLLKIKLRHTSGSSINSRMVETTSVSIDWCRFPELWLQNITDLGELSFVRCTDGIRVQGSIRRRTSFDLHDFHTINEEILIALVVRIPSENEELERREDACKMIVM